MKNILKNRTVLGLICILLSLVICFGVTPLFNSAISAQTEIVRVKADIGKGDLISGDSLEVVTVGGHNLPVNVIRKMDDAVGKYATCDMQAGDYILSGKLSVSSLSNSPYLVDLDGTKVAVSVTIPFFAAGLSGKLQAGDIITVMSTDNDKKTTTIRSELRYVEVLAVTASSGYDTENQTPERKDPNDQNSEPELPATLTLLVSTEQARVLAELEMSSEIHTALVYRGPRETAEKFLTVQDDFLKELETKLETAPQNNTEPAIGGQEGQHNGE